MTTANEAREQAWLSYSNWTTNKSPRQHFDSGYDAALASRPAAPAATDHSELIADAKDMLRDSEIGLRVDHNNMMRHLVDALEVLLAQTAGGQK